MGRGSRSAQRGELQRESAPVSRRHGDTELQKFVRERAGRSNRVQYLESEQFHRGAGYGVPK